MSRTAIVLALLGVALGCGRPPGRDGEGVAVMSVSESSPDGPAPGSSVRLYSVEAGRVVESPAISRSDQDWKERLSPAGYAVMRKKGTEAAFTGEFWNHHALGRYTCAGCGADLFLSQTKYDSGCGWPSFYAPVNSLNVALRPDHSHGMVRTEVLCRRCGAHLGHLFDDGPAPTGERYCINSVSLGFTEASPDSAPPAR